MTGIETIVASAGPWVVGVLTAVGGWLVGRRKHKAEASLLEIKAITAIREFYETALNDTKNQLQYYIQLTEDNRKEIEANKKELSEMRELIEKLINKSCVIEDCPVRQSFPRASLHKLKNHLHEANKNNIQETQE